MTTLIIIALVIALGIVSALARHYYTMYRFFLKAHDLED